MHFDESDKFTEQEKLALTYTSAIIWNSDIADAALWQKLHERFSIPELVELGFFVALTLGQQRWIKTLGIGHSEVLADNRTADAAGAGGSREPEAGGTIIGAKGSPNAIGGRPS